MGRIFKTPSDDSVENALKAMHTQNMVDNIYEKTMGWVKAVLFTTIGVFTVSFFEHSSDWNLWEATGAWFQQWVEGWFG